LHAGRTKYNEIEQAVGTSPARVIDNLIELRILERVAPVTDSPRRTRHSSYRIADVAVGPFWTSGKDSVAIDAVVLAGRSRAAVLVGEAKWTRVVNGVSIRRDLEKKVGASSKGGNGSRQAVVRGLRSREGDSNPRSARHHGPPYFLALKGPRKNSCRFLEPDSRCPILIQGFPSSSPHGYRNPLAPDSILT